MTVSIEKTIDFYEIAVVWWEGHGFPIIPSDMLPEKVLVTYNNSKQLTHMMFVYHTDSYLCWLAFPVSDPKLTRDDKKGCLENMMKASIEYCKQVGFKYVFTTSPVEAIQNKLISTGFVLGDEKVNHYIKIIK